MTGLRWPGTLGRRLTLALATLLLGKELIGKAGSSYAMGARQAIVEIDSSRFNELPWTVDELLAATSSDGGP